MEKERLYPGHGPATDDEISKRISNEIQSLSDSFGQALGLAVKTYQELEKTGKKGQLCFCYISFLRSSVLEQRSLYRLELYDEEELLDFEECSAEWDVKEISRYIYIDLPLTDKLVPTKEDWMDYEVEQLWITEAEKYHAGMGAVIRQIVDASRQLVEAQVQFRFGEYMDQSITV